MTTQRRELRMGILSLFDKHGVLCTIAKEMKLEDEIADLAISILKKKKIAKPRKQNDLTPIAYALADVCIIDFKANRGKLFAEAKRLMVATPTPTAQLIRLHYGHNGTWYMDDFRGKKGQPPSLGQVRLTWARLVSEGELGPAEYIV